MLVAVAAENLPTGTRLTKDHIKVVGWPSSSPVQGAFASPDPIVGRGLIQSVRANEPLTESKLAPIEAGAGLPPSIPPGMRAMAVRVNDVIGVAGFTVPGTRVDVLVTISRGELSMSRAVVSNVQVLTAGTLYDQEASKDGKAIPSAVVTLMLTPEDAEGSPRAQQGPSRSPSVRSCRSDRYRSANGEPDGDSRRRHRENGEGTATSRRGNRCQAPAPEAWKFSQSRRSRPERSERS